MTLPGPNLTHTTERRRRLLPSEVLFMQRPAQTRNIVQAMVKGLGVDKASRDAGYADGAAGLRMCVGDHDEFSYACGYVAGSQYGRSKRGG